MNVKRDHFGSKRRQTSSIKVEHIAGPITIQDIHTFNWPELALTGTLYSARNSNVMPTQSMQIWSVLLILV